MEDTAYSRKYLVFCWVCHDWHGKDRPRNEHLRWVVVRNPEFADNLNETIDREKEKGYW